MSAVDLAQLPEYLKAQRWFAGKSAAIRQINVVEALDLTRTLERPLLLAVVQVTFELGQPDLYFVPVTLTSEGRLADAVLDPGLAQFLINTVEGGQLVDAGTGHLRGDLLERAGLQSLSEDVNVRYLGKEQSNTSVVFDERILFKVLRRLQPGLNPELEIGRFLRQRTSFQATPTLLGALQLEGPFSGTVALAHAYVPNAEDGWALMTQAFQVSPTPSSALLTDIESLGSRVGELHAALSSAQDDPAFAPQPILQEDLQRWSSSIIGELGVTLAMAAPHFPSLDSHRGALLARATKLAGTPASGLKIRIHGDLHLGQVIKTSGGWWIIDFEGEPGRNFEQRREKQSPLRDVAGMLRSFQYAARAAGLTGDAQMVATRFAREFFLRGYRTAVPHHLLPEEDSFQTLLDALELEKALYEVRYELQSRPDWATIPVEFLMSTNAMPQDSLYAEVGVRGAGEHL